MNESMTVLFDTLDEAERAVSRLRRSGLDFRVRIRDDMREGSGPAASRLTASVYYPYHHVNQMFNVPPFMYDQSLGGRVVYTSDILGLPIYGGGKTEVRVSVEGDRADLVRSILVNSGGRFVF
jgi:hypothetical protein